jgi:transglutaminase-like putative cysteine protease
VPKTSALGGMLLYTPGEAIDTLEIMSATVQDTLKDPVDGPYVVERAHRIIGAAPARGWSAQIDLIRQYLEHSFHFVDNPVGLQAVQPPAELLRSIQVSGSAQGACDDAAMLVALLGMADGLPARFVAYAFCEVNASSDDPPPFTHVIGELFDGSHWVMLDITRPRDMFRLPCVARTLALELR